MSARRVLGGLDEAGRGCLLGPLVVAGVSVTAEGAREFREMGVRDSKMLSPSRREALYPEILRVAQRVHWVDISPDEIDEVVVRGRRLKKLNYLEAVYFAKVIDALGAPKVTVDASDVIPRRFRDDIVANLGKHCQVTALHKADRNFPVVSAASVIAKVERDRAVARLREEHGDFGSGYPSDPTTRAFFIDRMGRGEPLPSYVRKSWRTWLNLEQTLMDSF
ncbi:MAG TPA: ribonuclease HII [Nitrososphaerales archaeon]|nr:ribonuclease HII [Nitrososphaerales archaeon]